MFTGIVKRAPESLPVTVSIVFKVVEVPNNVLTVVAVKFKVVPIIVLETLVPIVRRTLELMDEMGIIELPLKIDGLQVKIVPVSPLALASN